MLITIGTNGSCAGMILVTDGEKIGMCEQFHTVVRFGGFLFLGTLAASYRPGNKEEEKKKKQKPKNTPSR